MSFSQGFGRCARCFGVPIRPRACQQGAGASLQGDAARTSTVLGGPVVVFPLSRRVVIRAVGAR